MLQGGTIFERFSKSPSFPEHTCAKIARQLLSAVSYLNSMGYVHGDIHPNNIFFRSQDDEFVKLTDFGISRRI